MEYSEFDDEYIPEISFFSVKRGHKNYGKEKKWNNNKYQQCSGNFGLP
jgi:hypothetical protein